MEDKDLHSELRRALAGDEAARNRLVLAFKPVIHARVARCFYSVGPAAGRDIRTEVEDVVQDVLLLLFAKRGRVLSKWDPKRGSTLLNYVGLIAKRKALSKLRSKLWKEDPTVDEKLDRPAPAPDPYQEAASQEERRLLLERLRAELSPDGWHLFDLLYLQELSVEEVARQTGRSADAIYAFRSRLRKLVRRLLDEMSE